MTILKTKDQEKQHISEQLKPLMDAEIFGLPDVIDGLAKEIEQHYSTARIEVLELLKIAANLSREN